MLPRLWRLLLLTLHITLNAVWLGALTGELILLARHDASATQAAFEVHDVLVVFASLAVTVTGSVFSLFTPWGFFRFPWVTTKWAVLAVLALVTVLLHTPALNTAAAWADVLGPAFIDDAAARDAWQSSALWGLLELVLLVGIIALSVVKPWGRRGHDEGPLPWRWRAALAACVVVGVGFAVIQSAALASLRRAPIPLVDVASARDGTWRGVAEGAPFRCEVDVTVAGGRLAALAAVDCLSGTYPELARLVERKVVARQSIDVDGVTGATTTSRTLLRAAGAALRAAGSSPTPSSPPPSP